MGILETTALILALLWLAGFALNIGGSLIHILLVLAIIAFLARFFRSSTA